MKKDVTKIDTMLELQGDRVILVDGKGKSSLILTIVHLVDFGKRELMLVSREGKTRESWSLTQDLMDRLAPFATKEDPLVKWKLAL